MAALKLEPIRPAHADALFPLLHGSMVTDTIAWDGPASLDELRTGFARRRAKDSPLFAIIYEGAAVGSIDLRPVREDFRVGTGLWVGVPYQGLGIGTRAIAAVSELAFASGAQKLEASVFVGNVASRRALEKNAFQLEGTIRAAIRKRGRLVDEWVFGLLREEFASGH